MGARRLEKIIGQVYRPHIPHNGSTDTSLKRIWLVRNQRRGGEEEALRRYEREHSMSAGHIDWFGYGNIQLCAILDDASRKVLGAREFWYATRVLVC